MSEEESQEFEDFQREMWEQQNIERELEPED